MLEETKRLGFDFAAEGRDGCLLKDCNYFTIKGSLLLKVILLVRSVLLAQ